MPVSEYDVVFVGGGLAAGLLLDGLDGRLPDRVAVVDPHPLRTDPSVHWSYWSRQETPYDRFAIGEWYHARVGDAPPQPIAPFTLRLVRSADILAHLNSRLEPLPIAWLRATARSITNRQDGWYEVVTDTDTLRARWVFDSACDVGPVFPDRSRPWTLVGGTGVRITSDVPVFDAATATLFDPLDERSFAYLLPLNEHEALLESASFGPSPEKTDISPLLKYLESRYPRGDLSVSTAESGAIPLGFAPSRTSGPQHVLLGTKRGLVKPSAGYGVVRIAAETEGLARLWREGLPLPPIRHPSRALAALDAGFLELAGKDPHLSQKLLGDVMRAVPIVESLHFIDEDLPPDRLARVFLSALPAVLRGVGRR